MSSPNVSVCFPRRPDDGRRDEIAYWILARWNSFFPEFEYLLADSDADKPFSRAQAINRAVRAASYDRLIIADLDVIIHKEFIDAALAMDGWGFPYRSYFNLRMACSDWMLSKPAETIFPLDNTSFGLWGNENVSGLMFITSEDFKKVGGFDEGFVGWGYEDVAFAKRATSILGPPKRVESGYVLHLWHEVVKEPEDNPNKARYDKYYVDGVKTVGLYCDWPESFESLITRMQRTSVDLTDDGRCGSLQFVKPDEPHEYALVYNATDLEIKCPKDHTYVLLFEPVEILGENNPWLTGEHPQYGAKLYSFCSVGISRSGFKLAYGLHLAQANWVPDETGPSKKPNHAAMICSYKEYTPYHRKRREVLDELRKRKDLDIHFWGRGMELDPEDPRVKGEITDSVKDIALHSYAFVLDFENTFRNAITDKALDPLISNAVPVTNSPIASTLFPSDSVEFVDFTISTDRIVDRILDILNQKDLEKYDAPVLKARECIKSHLNISSWLEEQIDQYEEDMLIRGCPCPYL